MKKKIKEGEIEIGLDTCVEEKNKKKKKRNEMCMDEKEMKERKIIEKIKNPN